MLVLFIFPTTIYAMQNNQINTDASKLLEEKPETHSNKFPQELPHIQVRRHRRAQLRYLTQSPSSVTRCSTSLISVSRQAQLATVTGVLDLAAQVLTDHKIVVQVENGVVISAVIDGVWDELTQSSVSTNDVSSDGVSTPESARMSSSATLFLDTA